MKKLILASAIAALSMTAAQAAPKVYGKAYLLAQYQEDGDVTLDSKSSRIGLKGSEALTQNTDVVYKLEYQIDVDSNEKVNGIAKSRDTYLGLSNKEMGTLVAGRLTSIDDNVNYANVAQGMYDGILASYDGDRHNNAMAYFSPEYDGLQFMAMYKFTDEGNGGEDKLADADGSFGVGAKYEQGPLKAGASYINLNGEDNNPNVIRVSGAYDLTQQLTVGALFQMIDFDASDVEDENSITVSGEYDVINSPWAVYGQFDMVTDEGGEKDADTNKYVVGGKYGFTKAATGHVFMGYVDSDDNNDDNDKFGIGTGLEYKF